MDSKRKVLLLKKWDTQVTLMGRRRPRLKSHKLIAEIPCKVKESIIAEYYWKMKRKYLKDLSEWLRKNNELKSLESEEILESAQKASSRARQVPSRPTLQFIPTEKQLEALMHQPIA
eukprot:TRINITY_DN3596_c0_g1_i2.p1 TRINITY_DN3596_c0_g1~~TRINITY_DN3596_c0_g1_i2.p1  ORF type:complete len:117 (-),score=32.10 TRINITY_DN3596_c0_g1_i2:14-364(-)